MVATEPKLLQAPPPLVEYCQLPLSAAVAVMAMPVTLPVSTSPRLPPPLVRMAVTVCPALLMSSSVMAVRTGAAAVVRTGASLTRMPALAAAVL